MAQSSPQEKEGGTFQYQSTLPRLPIPTLEETLEKFEHITLPALLTSPSEQLALKASVEDFLATDGPILQKLLQEYEDENIRTHRTGSYVEEFWTEAYLAPDASVVLNLNPYFLLADAPDATKTSGTTPCIDRAASLCAAAVRVASALRRKEWAPDKTKRGRPLCMDQYKALFGASRQPRDGAEGGDDYVQVYKDSSHVVILCNAQFYYVPVLWPHTAHVAVDESDWHRILQQVMTDAHLIDTQTANASSLGVLTSLPRSEWAVARQKLVEQGGPNEKSLTIIDSALFVLVLDDYAPNTIHEAASNILHGTSELAPEDTAQVGTCLNRWYDKLQIIVGADGSCGINFEHSAIDGHTALRFVSDVFAETVISFAETIVDVIHGRGRIQHVVEATLQRAIQAEPGTPNVPDATPQKLVFDVPDAVLTQLYYAETKLSDELGACDTYVLEFQEFGKRFITENNLSPDSVVQMSILLAYYRLYGKVVSMYEPVLTKCFYHGRTEAIRGATAQAKTLCEAWCSKAATSSEKMNALKVATIEHSRLVRESAAGKGVDRHLFSLKCIASRNGLPKPKFFESRAWQALNHTILSTSNCGNPALRLFGFGPVVADGFGIGYIIKDSGLSYSVSSKQRQTQRYVRSLEKVLLEIRTIVNESKSQPSLPKSQPSNESYRGDEFPDIWGESAVDSCKPLAVEGRRVSQSFSTVIERDSSLSILESLE